METLSAEWKRATRAGRPFSIVLIDLDRFKFVNDFYGHLEGDLVLRRVAQLLEENCRRSDIVARYGGDEFVVLMPETNSEQARQLAGKLRSWICSDTLLRERNVTGSFGIPSFPVHGSTPQELIQVADASMYLSKHQGGNAVSTADHFDPNETKRWKRDVLEAYLGVTLKRLFKTGPEAYEEICNRLDQFMRSVESTEIRPPNGEDHLQAVGSQSPEDARAAQQTPPLIVETLTSLALAIDGKDPFTHNHSQNVSSYAVALAEALEMEKTEVEAIRLAGLLHDIGKVGIPEVVLNKNGPLNPDEWELIMQHINYGAVIIEKCKGLEHIREMVLHHHEFFDGSGYPHALAGEAIPLGARIISIADAYDTITSERSYKRARGAEDALTELDRCAGAQFDPKLVSLFVNRMRSLPHPAAETEPSSEKKLSRTALPPSFPPADLSSQFLPRLGSSVLLCYAHICYVRVCYARISPGEVSHASRQNSLGGRGKISRHRTIRATPCRWMPTENRTAPRGRWNSCCSRWAPARPPMWWTS